MNPWIKILCLVVAGSIGFGGGYSVAHLIGSRDLSAASGEWDKEREAIATKRADAVTAQRAAEQKQADAIREAAKSYEKGKADAEAANAGVVAGLRSGAIRLRNEWAACNATSALVSSAGAASQPDAASDDRAASAGRIVRAAAQCDAQVVGLQQALIGERAGQ